jgi:hypothetical protein
MSNTRISTGAALLGLVLGVSSPASAQQVQLSIANGRVTLVARDATVRQILTEWARVGQTNILNVERIPGGPVTIELTNVSEDEALDVLLRSVAGYVTAPRSSAVATLSRYDRILVMPTTSTPPRAAAAPAAARPQPLLPPPTDDPADDPAPAIGGVPARGPVFTAFPQPQIVTPDGAPAGGGPGQPANTPQPASPAGGVAVPGMIVPPPAQPGQQPGAPRPPQR